MSVDKTAASTLLNDLGLRPSDVLNQDMCILVEGATDVIFFEHVIRILYADEFQKIAVAIIQYGGGAAEAIVSGSINVSNIVPAQRFTYWIRDRDAQPMLAPATSSTRFVNALTTGGMEAYVWNKREIEYYFPEPVVVAAQQGDGTKEQMALTILRGDQSEKFRVAAAPHAVCVPAGQYLKRLLKEHVTARTQLDQEIRNLVEQKLIPWRDQILGQ